MQSAENEIARSVGNDGNGKPAIRHQMDMILYTDSRVVNLATRFFGASASAVVVGDKR